MYYIYETYDIWYIQYTYIPKYRSINEKCGSASFIKKDGLLLGEMVNSWVKLFNNFRIAWIFIMKLCPFYQHFPWHVLTSSILKYAVSVHVLTTISPYH